MKIQYTGYKANDKNGRFYKEYDILVKFKADKDKYIIYKNSKYKKKED